MKFIGFAAALLCAFTLQAHSQTFTAPPGTGSPLATTPLAKVTPQSLGAICDGTTDDRAAFAAADALVASFGPIYVSGGTCRIASSITLTHALEFVSGGILKPDNGVTVTINAPVTAGDLQIFDISAGGLIRGTMKVTDNLADWWGAFGDGTNPSATHAAGQAGIDYIGASTSPNAFLTFTGSHYDFGTTGLVKAQSGNCPRIRGLGKNSTLLSISPSSEMPIIELIGTSGACHGGVSDLAMSGNSNTIGCQFSAVVGAYCDIKWISGKMPILWCNCHASGFAEQDIATVEIENFGNTSYLGEYRVTSGDCSFHGSGFGPGTSVSKTLPKSPNNPLIWISSSCAQVYNAPLNVKFFNLGAGTSVLIENDATPAANFISGALDLETDNAAPIVLADPNHGITYYGGTMQLLGGDMCSGVLPSRMVFSKIYTVGPSGVVHVNDAIANCIERTFTGSAGYQFYSSPLVENNREYTIAIYNSDLSYLWYGTVKAVTQTSGGGACAAGVVQLTAGGYLQALTNDTHGWGYPTWGCNNSAPTVINSSWPGTTFKVAFSVDAPQ